jgi:hypothetical protein
MTWRMRQSCLPHPPRHPAIQRRRSCWDRGGVATRGEIALGAAKDVYNGLPRFSRGGDGAA